MSRGVHLRENFLSPFLLVSVLDALDGLAGRWVASERLGLVGRGGVGQVRGRAPGERARLDQLSGTLAPAVLAWAKACGFAFRRPPRLQLFPVRMVGDAASPSGQAPHVDEAPGEARPPICTSVFYARVRDTVGGALAVASGDGEDPVLIEPKSNLIATFAGDRVHWVQPLFAGERLSIVVNLY